MAETKEGKAASPEDGEASQQPVVATRVTVDEVRERMERGEPFAFVDTRNSNAWEAGDTKLPGAIRVPADEVEKHLEEIPRDRSVITYCT
jgi:rhodanese-related sulfurtransferase